MIYRSAKYMKYVRSLDCYYHPGRKSGPPHHIKGVGHMSGVSLTAPDWTAMPLCPECHDEIQRNPDMWPEQWEIIARTLGKAVEDGVLIIGKKS